MSIQDQIVVTGKLQSVKSAATGNVVFSIAANGGTMEDRKIGQLHKIQGEKLDVKVTLDPQVLKPAQTDIED